MSTLVLSLSEGSGGPRVAIKDLIDWAGTPTTAGSRAVAERATAAVADAACLAGLRAAVGDGRATVVGKANLHELALGTTGVNPWFGTPVNPVDARLVPGGSSSGSAVAVASEVADWAVGTDTGGSVRIPAACCAVVGLKTTAGRLPLGGVWPLAPSLDSVGPLARRVGGVVDAMAVLDPGWRPAAADGPVEGVVGRLRLPGVAVERAVDAAVDAALAASGLPVVDIPVRGWSAAADDALTVLGFEAAEGLRQWRRLRLGDDVADALAHAAGIGHGRVRAARAACARWAARLTGLLDRDVVALALPTLPTPVPRLGDGVPPVVLTVPVNAAGLPALALPVGDGGRARSMQLASMQLVSMQLVGRPGDDELLCRIGAVVEAALG